MVLEEWNKPMYKRVFAPFGNVVEKQSNIQNNAIFDLWKDFI